MERTLGQGDGLSSSKPERGSSWVAVLVEASPVFCGEPLSIGVETNVTAKNILRRSTKKRHPHGLACIPGGKETDEGLHGLACILGGIEK